jgi:CRP/FNR family transcriptional regulator, cyclic AMP receptor protein
MNGGERQHFELGSHSIRLLGGGHMSNWPAASFLATLTDEQRADLLGRGAKRRLARGRTLMNQGEAGESVALLLDGTVKISAISADGHEALLGLRSVGDLLGEMAVATRGPRTARVVAATDITVRVLPEREFAGYLEQWPGAAAQVTAAVVRKLWTANERRAEFQSCTAAERVVIILSDTAELIGREVPGGVSIGPEITQADLASLATVSVSTIEKVLQSLEHDGLVERRRRALVVTDPRALRGRVGSGLVNPYRAGSRT